MSEAVLPDIHTRFGERVARRLRSEVVIWMTTVGAAGTPQPNPVWFIADGTRILIYSRADAARLANIRRNPRVALHFDGDGRGGDIIVLAGRATILNDQPLAHQVPEYMAKYESMAARVSGDVARFGAQYPIAIRVDVDRVRGF
jgi:PPOX class probable F420-dependent enzyme